MDQAITSIDYSKTVLARLLDIAAAAGTVEHVTDKYFSNTAAIVRGQGDIEVTYAVFLRRRAIAALEPAIAVLDRLVPEAKVKRFFAEGEVVPAERKMYEVTGPMSRLSEVETLLLQKTGFPCVSANNAYEMCLALPNAGFLDMHARHASGAEMNILAAYGAAVGAEAARQKNPQVKGFIGSSQDLTAPLFGAEHGVGTMPHSLVGYTGGDAVKAAKLFNKELPDAPVLIALVDYRGQEITDALKCAKWFYDDAKLNEQGKTFGVRIDTHGGRFCEGLDYDKSVDLVGEWLNVEGEYNIVEQVLGLRAALLDTGSILVDRVRRVLFGSGVSVASIIQMRKMLDREGFSDAQIVASSGFGIEKCHVVGAAHAPVDVIGTGSFLPATLTETYATADIIRYGDETCVKLGREFLID